MTSQGQTGMGLLHGPTVADLPREPRPTPQRPPLRPSPFAQQGER